MLKRCTNYYLYNISNHFASNIIVLLALLITELLTLLYSSIKSSLEISNNTASQPFLKKLSNASYYEIFSKNYNNTYEVVILYLMLFLSVMYLCLKCIALNFEKIRNNKKFMTIFINFYEIIVFRFCAIIFFDVSVQKMIKGAQGDIVFGFAIFIIQLFWFIYHYEIHYIYVSINAKTFFAFDNKIMQVSDKYFLLLKLLACINNHQIDNNKNLQIFMHLWLIVLNMISLLHVLNIIWKNKFHHFPKRTIVCFRVWSIIFINCSQLYGVMAINHNFIIFILIMAYLFIVSIFIMLGLQKISEIKMQSPNNEIGNILFLLSEPENQETNKIIIHNHISWCKIKNCSFCLKVNSKDQITKIKLIKLLLKKNKEAKKKNLDSPVEYFEIKTLLEYVTIYLSENNFIKIFIKYNKLKALIHSKKSFFSISEKNIINNFTKGFERNINILFQEIKSFIFNNLKNQKMIYLSTVDDLVSNIQTFFNLIYSFFSSFELRIPEKIFNLAKNYYLLKKTTDFSFLKKKENKFNYSCILVNYLLEELYNKPFINSNLDYSNFIFSMEDTLNYHFNENKILWILYQIHSSNFIIQRIGKDLIHFKGKNFEEIFPKDIRKEGKEKFKKELLKSNGVFDFYYQNNEAKTTEILSVNFFGVPSLRYQSHELNLICTYTIIKVGLIGFHKKTINSRKVKILVFLSEIITKYFKINQDDLHQGMHSFQYINQSDLLDNKKHLLNVNVIQQFLNNQTKLRLFLPKGNQYSYDCKESINNYDFFYVYEKGKKEKLCSTLIARNSEAEEVIKECEAKKKIEQLLSITHTYVSSTALTHQTNNIILKSFSSKKNEKKYKNLFFFRFIYYFSVFDILILCFIILFLVHEFVNNTQIKKIYNIICQYYDFQNYFYSVSLSISSLICKQNINNIGKCNNAFLEYSYQWVKENNLSVELLPIHYIAKEVTLKADMVIRWLKEWELSQNVIVSKKKDEILKQQFKFTILENLSGQITVNTIFLSFEEAIKRFALNANIIGSSDSVLSLSVYTISSDGKGNINLDNLRRNNEELNTIQNLFYTLILNFQKYIIRLIALGDLMNEIFLLKIKTTGNINFIYIFFLIVFHIIMIAMCLMYFNQFKKIHIQFYSKVYEKLNDHIFIIYYKRKLELLKNLLDLFKESPVLIVEKLIKIKKAENLRQEKLSQMKLNQKRKPNNEFVLIQKKQEINKKQIEHYFNNNYIIPFLFKIFFIFGLYLVLSGVCEILTLKSISYLMLMENYAKNNYELSNKIYMGMGLIQVMSLTNQTDQMLNEYFSVVDEDAGKKDFSQKNEYVRKIIEQIFKLVKENKQMEAKYSFFTPIDEVIEMDCSSLYKDINDYFIEIMVNKYPDSNYYDLFSNYCKSFKPLGIYSNHELAYEYIGHQMSQLLNMFVNQEYETYYLINNSSLIYQLYCEIIILIGPIRFFIYSHISNTVINKIIDNFVNSYITFLVVNIFFEAIILFFVKHAIVKHINVIIKEIIDFSRALECKI